MNSPVAIFWFRRDLRVEDNAGLWQALSSGLPVVPLFIFDLNILQQLESKQDLRVIFIHQQLEKLQQKIKALGSTLDVRVGNPLLIWQELISDYTIEKVFTNHDYEPYGIDRDQQVGELLQSKGISFHTFKDIVIFEKQEVLKDDGSPYTIFTPYSKKWKSVFAMHPPKPFPSETLLHNFYRQTTLSIPSLSDIGFESSEFAFPESEWKQQTILRYKADRDIPSIKGTTQLGVHLRFGTISIRMLAIQTGTLNETYLNELIWRDFYHMILWHFPRVGRGGAFRPVYDEIRWLNDERSFQLWCNGMTGYPIVDAGMRELNATGYMHNRVRMIVASFLTKHLLIDWRWGEAYFAQKLLDFDLAANNGGWQWAAGSGCDAAPYFRVFNPYLQTQKFDPAFKYIRKWIPELDSFDYPQPIVIHEVARKRCLEVYGAALKKEL